MFETETANGKQEGKPESRDFLRFAVRGKRQKTSILRSLKRRPHRPLVLVHQKEMGRARNRQNSPTGSRKEQTLYACVPDNVHDHRQDVR